MRYLKNKLTITAGLTLMSGMALAQSYSSFNQVDGIYGVHVDNTGLAYTVTLDPGAYLLFNSIHLDSRC